MDKTLGMIAGNRKFPLLFAQAAKRNGVAKLVAVAFEDETDPALADCVDVIEWVRLGQLGALIDRFKKHDVSRVVMVGQIAPKNLFARLSLDLRMTLLLAKLGTKNAESIFGAIADEIAKDGLELVPHSPYLKDFMPPAGTLTRRKPGKEEAADIRFGARIAKGIAALDIGQTVVVRGGAVLAVEAFEGTDACLERGGRLGEGAAVAVKATKPGQDMRFDIPVIGLATIETAAKSNIRVLAFEANRTLLLEKDEIVKKADEAGLCLIAFDPENDQ